MREIRWSVPLVCILLFGAGSACAQVIEPEYTSNPEFWREQQELATMAQWLKSAYLEPGIAFKEQVNEVMAYLGLEPYEVMMKAKQDESALRSVIADKLVAEARWDPVFAVVLEIGRMKFEEDRLAAVRSVQMFHDAVKTYVDIYPKVAEPAREVFLDKLSDERNGVVFVAIRGLALLPPESGSSEVTQALVKLLASEDEVIVAEAGVALGDMGSADAVKPLMERFIQIKENVDRQTDEDGAVSVPPLNNARYGIAIAVCKITGNDLEIETQTRKNEVLKRYQELLDWWNANKNNYL